MISLGCCTDCAGQGGLCCTQNSGHHHDIRVACPVDALTTRGGDAG